MITIINVYSQVWPGVHHCEGDKPDVFPYFVVVAEQGTDSIFQHLSLPVGRVVDRTIQHDE